MDGCAPGEVVSRTRQGRSREGMCQGDTQLQVWVSDGMGRDTECDKLPAGTCVCTANNA